MSYKKPKAFFVVSQWNNDVSWVEDYTDQYVIYDKSNTLEQSEKVIKCPNVGHNLHDIFHFIYNNYENLPEVVAFLEGNPWDHCNREKFNRIIYNEFFTPLESYENSPDYHAAMKSSDAGWMERNDSWYITSHPRKHESMFQSYHEALNYCFKNAYNPQFVRFSPGGMYLVEKKRLQHYSKEWWKKLLDIVSKHENQPEAYIMERMLWTIFACCFEENL